MRRQALSILVVMGIAATAVSTSAHHSRAVFDLDKYIDLEGVITEIRWVNPHMWGYLDVTDTSGKTERWGIEGPGAAAAVASGISPALLKVGARVIFKTHPARDPAKRIGDMQAVVLDGKTYYSRGPIVRSSENEK